MLDLKAVPDLATTKVHGNTFISLLQTGLWLQGLLCAFLYIMLLHLLNHLSLHLNLAVGSVSSSHLCFSRFTYSLQTF